MEIVQLHLENIEILKNSTEDEVTIYELENIPELSSRRPGSVPAGRLPRWRQWRSASPGQTGQTYRGQ